MTKSELTVADSIRARRSMKSFKSDPIPEATLQELVSLMQDAPSSWNFQPTRVVMIRSMVQKEALAAAAWGQKQILEAPVTFVFAVSIRGWEKNMSEILKSGVSSGAWAQKFADWIGENAPVCKRAFLCHHCTQEGLTSRVADQVEVSSLPEEGLVQREERKVSEAVELLVPKGLPEEGQREGVGVKGCEGHM